MRCKLTLLAAISIVLCAEAVALRRAAWIAPAAAHEEHDEEAARHALENGEIVPLERVIAELGAAVPGEISGLELEKEHGIWIYEFKIISPEGRMLKVRVDAKTGKLLKKTEH